MRERHLQPDSFLAARPLALRSLTIGWKAPEVGLLTGNWLDCGCAGGGHVMRLLERGVSQGTGMDVGQERIGEAQKRCSEDRCTSGPSAEVFSSDSGDPRQEHREGT